MKLLFEGWRGFLYEQLLEEGKIDDAKKKYALLDERGDIDKMVEALKANDVKVSKYITWMAKKLSVVEGNFAVINEERDRISDAIVKFDKNLQRIKNKDRKYRTDT